MVWGGWEQGCCLYFPSSVGRIPWEIVALGWEEGAVQGTGIGCQGFSSVTLPTVQLVTAKW